MHNRVMLCGITAATALSFGGSPASVSAQCGSWQPLLDGVPSRVNALTILNGELVAGADLSPEVMRWTDAGWQTLSGALNDSVESMIVFNGDLIVGGWFTGTAGSPGTLNRVARWTGSAWQPMGGGLPSGPVVGLTVYNGELLATGGQVIPNQGFSACARWTGSTWQPLGGGLNDSAACMIEFNGDLVVGGGFTLAGYPDGIPAKNIARWDGNSWHAMGAGFLGGAVSALAIYDGELIAAGSFEFSGAQPMNQIARWDGAQWQPMSGGLDGSNFEGIGTLVIYNNTLIAGGTINSAGGVPVSNVARWNGTNWLAMGGGFNSWVRSLILYDGALIAGGNFVAADGQPANHIAQWIDCPCPEDVNSSQDITVADLLIVINAWGDCPDPRNCAADVAPPGGDGAVNVLDLLAVISAWGPCQ